MSPPLRRSVVRLMPLLEGLRRLLPLLAALTIALGAVWFGHTTKVLQSDFDGGTGAVVRSLLLLAGLLLGVAGAAALLAASARASQRELERSQGDLQRRVRQQAAITSLGHCALVCGELDALLALAARELAATLGVEMAVVLERLPEDVALVRASVGVEEGSLPERCVIPRGSPTDLVLHSDRPVFVEDAATDARFTTPGLLSKAGAVSGMAVAIPGNGGAWGLLAACSRTSRRRSGDDLHFLQALANLLGVAISRAQAERGLREQEVLFRSVVEGLGEGIVLTDFDRISYVNPRFCELVGRSKEELVGQGVVACGVALDQSELERQTALRRQGIAGSWEGPFHHKDGHAVWLQVTGTPLRDGAGKLTGSIAAFADVTERRRAEEALSHTQQRLQHVLLHSPSALFTFPCAPPFRPAFISASTERVFGFSAEELAQPGFWDGRIHPEDVSAAEDALARLVATGAASLDYRFRHGDGHWRHLRNEMSLVRDDQGELIEVVGVAHDLTAQRLLEEALRQSQKMEAVGRLAGGVAHDFNNLLTAINGYSELLLLEMTEDAPRRHEVEEIRRAGERAAGLTRQLLAFSRRQVLQPRVLDLNVVVAETERMLRRIIGEDLHVVTDLATQPVITEVDPSQVEQVILNLAVNARDAMPNGGRLTVSTGERVLGEVDAHHPEARPGHWVFLRVSDDGCGIPPEILTHLFEPFFTTKEQGKGTGLGLSMVYGIAHQSGGWVEVESSVGKGSTFTVLLPATTRTVETAPDPGRIAGPGGGETVMVVEDEAAVRALLVRSLRERGYQVVDVANGNDAIAIARDTSSRVDLLITDVVMPGLRGTELRERMLAIRPGLSTLFISGYSDEDLSSIVESERVGFLQKPFTPAGLIRRVREMLDDDRRSFARATVN